MESPSYSKQGDLFISPCNFSEPLFPLHQSPHDWKSCHDAYSYSWTKDFKKEVIALSSRDSAKMINSMGFCPQNRCQLYNLTATGIDGMSPEGLCYTKVENGGLSYGACAFHNGVFNAGVLIGYYNKTQHTPKPIYKKSRIVLGNKRGELAGSDESIESFINANEIYPGLIGTQCSLASRPAGFQNTVDDVKRMIVENNITLWVQLAPSGLENFYLNGVYTPGTANCGVFPLEFFNNSSSGYSQGVSNFRVLNHNPSLPYVEMAYTITAYTSTQDNGRVSTTFEDMSINRHIRSTEHMLKRDLDPTPVRNIRTKSALISESDLPLIKADDIMEDGLNMVGDDVIEGGDVAAELDSNDLLQLESVTLEEIPLTWKKVTVNVRHFWYHKWKDFRVPPPEDESFLRSLAEDAALVLATGRESVAVNCLSGRGRTGTFSAIVLGKLLSIKTLTQLVDIIVGMRENRDGLVETPAQFKFAASALGLPDSSECSTSCSAKKVLDSVQSPGATTPFFTGFFVAVIIFVIFSAASKSNIFENLDNETLSSSKNNRYQHINKPPSHSQLDFDDGGIEANLKKKRES